MKNNLFKFIITEKLIRDLVQRLGTWIKTISQALVIVKYGITTWK